MSKKYLIDSADNISYSGSVNIQLKKGKYITNEYTFHNAGFPNLFKYLASTITNNGIIDGLKPNAIVLANGTDAVSNKVITQSPILLKELYNEDEEIIGYQATIHFVIYFGDIQGSSFNTMYLLPSNAIGNNTEKTNTSAKVDLPKQIELSADTVVIVDWNLKFTN